MVITDFYGLLSIPDYIIVAVLLLIFKNLDKLASTVDYNYFKLLHFENRKIKCDISYV